MEVESGDDRNAGGAKGETVVPLQAPEHATRALDDFFTAYFEEHPVNATFTGVHAHDHRLPDWSPAGLDRMHHRLSHVRRSLKAAGGYALGSVATRPVHWTQIDLALATGATEIQLAELESTHFQRGNPSLVVGEAVFALLSLVTRPFAPASERARVLEQRLAEVPRFLAESLSVLADAPRRDAWVERAQREITGARIFLDRGIAQWCRAESVPVDTANSLVEFAALASRAFAAFADALRYVPRRTEARYGCGVELLSLLLRQGHWCRANPEDLARDARTELEQERAQLHERALALDSRGWPGVQEALAAKRPSPDQYLASFGACWEACRQHADAHALVTWPEWPLQYVEIPEWTREAAPFLYYLFYRAPAPFDDLPVIDYVVPPLPIDDPAQTDRHLRQWNDSTIKLNHVVHHGALGHHVQNWYAARSPSRVGQVAAVDCASRIGLFCGGTMAEGWACYATDLMDEAGFLTPHESVAEQHSRVRMRARAVADVALHTGTMTLAEVIDWYVETTGMSPDLARGEAVKNSMFPGTALMYWLGTSSIHELRRAVARRDGSHFLLRNFHDELLSMGSIPVLLAAELMR